MGGCGERGFNIWNFSQHLLLNYFHNISLKSQVLCFLAFERRVELVYFNIIWINPLGKVTSLLRFGRFLNLIEDGLKFMFKWNLFKCYLNNRCISFIIYWLLIKVFLAIRLVLLNGMSPQSSSTSFSNSVVCV